ncbi:hypothetical protein [Hyphomicrobium sulfonivorans]|nr:hypothetical protein [Hyphomicrobium sulfonivorans]NSL72171.1 hypothetical protein [Hyphomicrobium sulfonivorans]
MRILGATANRCKQPLASALNAFRRQSGFQVTSAAAAVRGGEISFITAWAMTETENYRNADGDFMRVNVDGARAPAQNSPGSRLAKLQIRPNDTHNFNFGFLKYENEFTNSYYDWLIDNNTYYMNYALTPGNNLVEARVNLYYNQTNLLYEPNSTSSSYRGRTTEALRWGSSSFTAPPTTWTITALRIAAPTRPERWRRRAVLPTVRG